MFETGNLLLFKPFLFKNGALPKNKFMVVLGKDADGSMVLASLPTSKDYVPSDMEVKGGCLELPERQVNVFVFPAGECIAVNQSGGATFSFDVDTFIYGSNLDSYPIATFHQQMADKLTEVKFIGRISDIHFTALKDCLRKSRMVKNKFKRIL